MIIAVKVVNSIYAVFSRLESANCKLAFLVGLCNTLQLQRTHSRVVKIGIHANNHALRRLKITGFENHSGNLQRVYRIAGRKTNGKPVQLVTLVQIAHRVRKIYRIRCVRHKRITQTDGKFLSVSRYLRNIYLGRRNNNLSHSVFHLNILIKKQFYPRLVNITLPYRRRRTQKNRRSIVILSTRRAPYRGTCSQQSRNGNSYKQTQPVSVVIIEIHPFSLIKH